MLVSILASVMMIAWFVIGLIYSYVFDSATNALICYALSSVWTGILILNK